MDKSHKYSDPEILGSIGGIGLRSRRVMEGPVTGAHKSPFHGASVEFAEYREYSPGDDLRRLDWRVLARTDRYFLKQYEQESNLRATLVVDASRSMAYGPAGNTKFDCAARIATSLATILIEQSDSVGMSLFDSQRRQWLPPSSTQGQIMQIHRELESAVPDRTTEIGTVLQSLADQVKQRGMIVLLSDLLTDLPTLFEGLDRLMFRGHEVLILQILDNDEIDLPFNDLILFKDIEGEEELFAEPWGFRKAYQNAMNEFIDEVKRQCGLRSIDHTLLRTQDSIANSLSLFLHARARSMHVKR